MKFGDILDKWEKQSASGNAYYRDAAASRDETTRNRTYLGERRSRLLRKKPDATIDLHGLNRDEAWDALENFFGNCRRMGHEKLLIIHGKGNHSGNFSGKVSDGGDSRSGEAVLKDTARSFIEHCSFAGESGFSNARGGGSGATWVLLKE